MGEVLKQLTEEKCKWIRLLVKKKRMDSPLPPPTFEMLIILMTIVKVDAILA